MSGQFDVVEHVLELLQHGRRSSTYKHAVLIGLMDLCLEHTDGLGWPPSMLTTRQLAEKVVELYWPQVTSWREKPLKQNVGKQGAILRAVEELRLEAAPAIGAGASAARVGLAMPEQYERVVRTVEWKLIEMPLPKLQRVGELDTGWLYRIGWDDGDSKPGEGRVRAYQEGRASDFDNRILLRSEVAMAFVRLHGLLRPFVEDQWAKDVARLNGLEASRLRRFLFGASRTALVAVRLPLLGIQQGRCFYCDDAIAAKDSQVDHFVPWSRHPDDGLHNLVVAHSRCNNAKSDFLAAPAHIRRWRGRNVDKASDLAAISRRLTWELGESTALGAARAVYLRLPGTARLWVRPKQFEIADTRALQHALA